MDSKPLNAFYTFRIGAVHCEGLPTPDGTSRLLSRYHGGEPFSSTNRLLAQVLAKSVLGKLLLTTNFDDQIERAINRLGRAPAVIDAPEAIYRLDLDSPHPKIVYLHGKFVFNDLAHSPAESAVRNSAMVQWVRNLMIERSPIVVGYSGEMEDFFVAALRWALAKRPAAAPPAFWFCFDPSDAPRILANFSNHPALHVVADASTLPAHTALSDLINAIAPDCLSGVTCWSIPSLDATPSQEQCQEFVRRAASIHIDDIEDGELAQFIDKLDVCRMQLKDKGKLDDATTLALAAAEKLFQRGPTHLETRRHLVRGLNARAYFLYEHERYSESLDVLDRFNAEFGHETPPRSPRALVFNHFYRSRVLDELKRADEMEAEQRECLKFMQAGADPEVLGHAMMAVSNLANHLVYKKSDDARAEAKRLRERIHEVYPGPVTYECVQANYRSWNAIGIEYYSDNEYAAALAAFDNVLRGQHDLFANDLGDLVFDAMEMRSWLFLFEKRYRELDDELTGIGRLFGPEKQRALTIRIGKVKLTMMGKLVGLGVSLKPDELSFPMVLWDEAQTPEEQAQLARFSLMRIDCYLHRHEYVECIGAAEDLFNRL